jgi:hypothetical protein
VARLGRRSFMALYAFLALYVIVAGMLAIVPQIFGSPVASGSPPALCPGALEDLRRDLVDRFSAQAREITSESDGRWLDRWNRRYRALHASCGSHEAYPLLAPARDRAAAQLRLFREDQAELTAALRRDEDAAP